MRSSGRRPRRAELAAARSCGHRAEPPTRTPAATPDRRASGDGRGRSARRARRLSASRRRPRRRHARSRRPGRCPRCHAADAHSRLMPTTGAVGLLGRRSAAPAVPAATVLPRRSGKSPRGLRRGPPPASGRGRPGLRPRGRGAVAIPQRRRARRGRDLPAPPAAAGAAGRGVGLPKSAPGRVGPDRGSVIAGDRTREEGLQCNTGQFFVSRITFTCRRARHSWDAEKARSPAGAVGKTFAARKLCAVRTLRRSAQLPVGHAARSGRVRSVGGARSDRPRDQLGDRGKWRMPTPGRCRFPL